MAAVRQIKAFIAQWEIRYLLSPERHGKTGPVVKRRINDFVVYKISVFAGYGKMADFAPPAFYQ